MEAFFREIIIVSLAAVTLVPLVYRLGMGVIIAYILAGFMVGPTVLSFINDLEVIEKASELGVIFLLFIVGLSLTPRKLKKVSRHIAFTGPLQMLTATTVIALVGNWIFSLSAVAALALGLALALSSTAFGLRYIQDHPLPQRVKGDAVTGILIFQDLCVAPILIFLSVFEEGQLDLPIIPLIAFFCLIAFYFFMSDRLLRFLTYDRFPEIFTAACLLIVIGASYLSKIAFGTTSIGALAAGIVLAQSHYVERIQLNLLPFKGLLLGLFFMSIGMGLGRNISVDSLVWIIGTAFTIVIGKSLMVALVVFNQSKSLSRSLYSGAILSQAGEFGFIIVIAAREAGVFESSLAEFVSATIAVSLTIPPLILPFLSPKVQVR